MTPLQIVIGLVAIALVFDFINGFHDAANSIATVVSTRVLSPRAAVVWAAFFNFVAFLVYPTHVSASIAKGVELSSVTYNVIFATLIGAIVWNLLTWWWGLPSSSSHALMGAFAGGALANTPSLSVLDMRVFGKTIAFIAIAPLLALAVDFGAAYPLVRLAALLSYGLAGLSALAFVLRAFGPGTGRLLGTFSFVLTFLVIGAQTAWLCRPYLGSPRDASVPLFAHGRIEGGLLGALTRSGAP